MKAIILCVLSSSFVLQSIAQSNSTNAPIINHSEAESSTMSNGLIKQQNTNDTTFLRTTNTKTETISTDKKELKRSDKLSSDLKEEQSFEKAEKSISPIPNITEMEAAKDSDLSSQSFEQNFSTFCNSKYDVSKANNLFVAAQMQPENLEVQKQLMGYYVITNKDQAFDSIAEKVCKKEGRTEADYNYFGDLCSSVSQNSTLVLHGVTDFNLNYQTRECYEKKNVELISFEYLPSNEYQQQLKDKGFKLPESNEFNPAYLQNFCELNQDKNIYLSMTFPKEFLKPIQKSIVPVGLSFHYGYTVNPNVTNQNLWENSWKQTITAEKLTSFSDGLAKNYIPSLLVLRKYYQQQGYSDEIKAIDEKIQAIGKRANIPSETIQQLIK